MTIEILPPVDAKRELAETLERLKKGIRDPEAMRRARDRMDAMREQIFKQHGIVDLAVQLVREARDE